MAEEPFEKEELKAVEETSDVESLQLELTQLRESFSKQEENIGAYLEQIKRLQADFENWRKRVEQDKMFLVESASSVLIEKLLPVLDSFERALQAFTKSKGDSAFKEGMNLIYRQLLDLLKEEGMAPIETRGSLFDPSLHEAYSTEEREAGEDHQVIEEARKGYLFKGKVLRPALVKVSKLVHPASNASSEMESTK